MSDDPKIRGRGTALGYGPRKCPTCNTTTTVRSVQREDEQWWYALHCGCRVRQWAWVDQTPIHDEGGG